MKPILTLTPPAVEAALAALRDGTDTYVGLRIFLRKKGCAGFQYVVERAKVVPETDIVVQQQGLTLFIPKASVMLVLGSCLDYQKTPLTEGFLFSNPQEKGRCGCGESIYVNA